MRHAAPLVANVARDGAVVTCISTVRRQHSVATIRQLAGCRDLTAPMHELPRRIESTVGFCQPMGVYMTVPSPKHPSIAGNARMNMRDLA
jgi:hypothetical protein